MKLRGRVGILLLLVASVLGYVWPSNRGEPSHQEIAMAMCAGGWKRFQMLRRLDPLRVDGSYEGVNIVIAMKVQDGMEAGYFMYGQKSSTQFSAPIKWNMRRSDSPSLFLYRRPSPLG